MLSNAFFLSSLGLVVKQNDVAPVARMVLVDVTREGGGRAERLGTKPTIESGVIFVARLLAVAQLQNKGRIFIADVVR